MCFKRFNNKIMDNKCISFPVSLNRLMQHFLGHVCWLSCVIGIILFKFQSFHLKNKGGDRGSSNNVFLFFWCDSFFKISWLRVILVCYSMLFNVTLHIFTKMLWMLSRGPHNFGILQVNLKQFSTFCCAGVLNNKKRGGKKWQLKT